METRFSALLKTRRVAEGLSLNEVAEKCDCSRALVWQLERGIQVPSVRMGIALARLWEKDMLVACLEARGEDAAIGILMKGGK